MRIIGVTIFLMAVKIAALRATCTEECSKEPVQRVYNSETCWQLIFRNEKFSGVETLRAVKGEVWTEPTTPRVYDLSQPMKGAWVDKDFIWNWTKHSKSPSKVRFAFWKRVWGRVEPVVDIIFDGNNSNILSWFNPSKVVNVVKGPFVRSNPAEAINLGRYWSATGDLTRKRPFFINRNYGGCEKDFGMIAVTDKVDVCNGFWLGGNSPEKFPRFLYAGKEEGCLWIDPTCSQEADFITISVA